MISKEKSKIKISIKFFIDILPNMSIRTMGRNALVPAMLNKYRTFASLP